MNYCYLTGIELTEENKSCEHILPNALGGKLKSNNVLCSDANQNLSKLIDTDFNKIFENTYRRLPLHKDRENTRGITGIHPQYQAQIVLKDGKCFPRKPIYDSEQRIVYAQTEKEGQGWIGKLKKDGEISQEQEVNVLTDLAGEIHFPFTLDNNIFRKGFAKIAAGFATHQGIDRKHLRGIIDLDNCKFRDDILLFPFFPTKSEETLFENGTSTSIHFPLHIIVLHGCKKEQILYCYIELFSTFQFIVLIDNDYTGEDIYHSYFYDLLNGKEIDYQTYLDSIAIDSVFKNILTEYKRFGSNDFDYLNGICRGEQDLLRMYGHDKFHKLEAFVAYYTQK